MAARQRLRSLNPFRPVTRVINRAPFEIIFMVSHIHMPPEGNFIHPLHLTLRKTLRSNGEIDFDPLIFDRGHAPPQYIFVVDANDAGNLNAPYLALSRNLLMSNARVTIGLNRAQRQLFAEGQQGTPFQRARALVKLKIAHKRMKNLFNTKDGSELLYSEEPPAGPAGPPPSPDAAHAQLL